MMICTRCRRPVPEERAVVGPGQEPFCTGECRNAWIWYSQAEPAVAPSRALLRASRAAQTEYLRRLQACHEASTVNIVVRP
jgi:hypothetical protein